MKFYKNGFVVTEISDKKSELYILENLNIWPLDNLDLNDDPIGKALIDSEYSYYYSDEKLGCVPDSDYVKRYFRHCKDLHMDVTILLFESFDDAVMIDANDKLKIKKVLGYDCTACVSLSYLQWEYTQYPELAERGFTFNKYGFLDSLEGVLYFTKLRQETRASGINIEDFWDETPTRISIVDIL